MRRTRARAGCLAALAAALLATTACSPGPSAGAVQAAATASPSTGVPVPAADGAGATAGLTTASPGESPAPGRACTLTVGSQVRERTTAAPDGAVEVLAGPLDCRAVGVWVSTFRLDQEPASDPPARFAGLYTGARGLTVTLPTPAAPCSAAAVHLAVDADGADDTAAASAAAAAVRADLASWPADRAATVPAASILRGRASGVLAASVVGDPSRCSPGRNVDTPPAAVGDCWLAMAPQPTGGPGDRSGFRRTGCSAAHTHEVYWAEGLTTASYLEQTRGRDLSAPAWARRRAVEVCQARRTTLRLEGGVRQADVTFEVLWPSDLGYPPRAGSPDWSRAQVVCLARWADGRSDARRLLHP